MSAIRRPKQDQKLSPSRHFEARFTAISNVLLCDLFDVRKGFTPSEVSVALFISRVTVGYIRHRTTIRTKWALDQIGLSRSSYLAAKRGLIEKGVIICETDRFQESIVQLHPKYQCLLSDFAGGSENLDEGGPNFRTPTNKEIKKTIKTKQHQATLCVADDFADDEFGIDSIDSRVEQEDPEILACVEAIEDQFEQEQALVESVPFQDSAAPVVEAEPAKSLPKPEITSEQFQLAQGLNRNGVNWRMAVRLAKENDPQAIQKALDGLKLRSNVKHPAGWLVEEIRAGGYAAPGLSAEALIKRTHESVAQLRQQERQQEQTAREEANQAYFERWSQFEALPFETQQELLTTARQRLARLSPKMAELPDNSPPLRAMALELARERIPANDISLPANQCLENQGLVQGLRNGR
jgi:hypothetical protein